MTAVKAGSDISILPDSAYQLVKEIFITVKTDYLHLYTAYQSSNKLSSKAMQSVYVELAHFYQRYDDRMTPYLAQDLYEQIKQVERLVEILTTCDQALENLDQTISLIEHQYEDEAVINDAMKKVRKQYQALLEKVGLDGSVMDQVNQAIDDIHGQYRRLNVQNKALFFAQLENIHDQTIKYIRHYIEIEFIQKRIDYGFDQFNTFLRLVVDNAVYRKQSGD
ncbi:hypothetical protein CRI85_10505 [Leuconostoc pseudomesenteroides]|uniref:hypothetical protein n=1 Tax=Leuconostoc pseudomesenteroides TaxID=33968 RepID=UPI001E39EB39|nr:hypothetical protein [Leuconostoc pseudomesenteroides]MCC8440739.1 hypothetical protein [Leuconostoc pseudomesenteroides]